jgi:hypothetical protein
MACWNTFSSRKQRIFVFSSTFQDIGQGELPIAVLSLKTVGAITHHR